MTKRIVRDATSAMVIALVHASAQTPAAPSFEVASIRQRASVAAQAANGRRVAGTSMTFSGQTARVTGATLGSLIGFAYDLKSYEFGEGAWPTWKSEQFDIFGKAEGDGALTPRSVPSVVSSALGGALQVEVSPRNERDVWLMLTAAKNGPKIKPSDPDVDGSIRHSEKPSEN